MKCSRTVWLAVAVAAPVWLAAACGTARPAGPLVAPVASVASTIAVPTELKIRVAGRIVSVALEDYVAGTAVSEVTPVGESARTIERVYDVQTIVARTYALAHLGRHRADGFDLCDSTHCQLYEPARLATSRFAGDVRRAGFRTAGQVLTFNARPIDALFHADCGGHTTTPELVWGTPPLPYLRAEPDQAPALTHRSWTVSLTLEQLRIALNADARTAPGKRLTSISADPNDRSGRVTGIEISGDRRIDVRGDDFRAVMNRTLGAKGIQSTRFSIKATGTTYVLTGTGYGHGIGLCQQGTLARARLETPTETILSGYFPGARLESLGGRIP